MSSKINIDLETKKTDISNTLTFGELYEQMLEEIDTYKRLELSEELMSSPIYVSVTDVNGSIIGSPIRDFIGFLESGVSGLSGEIDYVYDQIVRREVKSDAIRLNDEK